MIKQGNVLTNKDVVELFGTEKQKEKFKKDNTIKGDPKKALLKKLQSECDFEEYKEGRTTYYKILEVHNIKKEVVDKRKVGNNSVFTNDFKNIMIDCIYNSNKLLVEEMIISKTNLFQLVNLINNNYKIGRKDKEKLAQMLRKQLMISTTIAIVNLLKQ